MNRESRVAGGNAWSQSSQVVEIPYYDRRSDDIAKCPHFLRCEAALPAYWAYLVCSGIPIYTVYTSIDDSCYHGPSISVPYAISITLSSFTFSLLPNKQSLRRAQVRSLLDIQYRLIESKFYSRSTRKHPV